MLVNFSLSDTCRIKKKDIKTEDIEMEIHKYGKMKRLTKRV